MNAFKMLSIISWAMMSYSTFAGFQWVPANSKINMNQLVVGTEEGGIKRHICSYIINDNERVIGKETGNPGGNCNAYAKPNQVRGGEKYDLLIFDNENRDKNKYYYSWVRLDKPESQFAHIDIFKGKEKYITRTTHQVEERVEIKSKKFGVHITISSRLVTKDCGIHCGESDKSSIKECRYEYGGECFSKSTEEVLILRDIDLEESNEIDLEDLKKEEQELAKRQEELARKRAMLTKNRPAKS